MTEECYERLLTEREQLDSRLHKLELFLSTDKGLPAVDLGLLYAQQCAMRSYLDILDKRLERCVVNG